MIPISSYAMIMYAALLHLIEGLIVLTSHAADGSIGVHALLRTIPDHDGLAVALFASSLLAMIVLWRARAMPILLVPLILAPQQAFLFTTGIAAWVAVWHGSYSDGVLRSPLFITADQLPRGMFSLMHLTAIYAITVFKARPKA